MVDIALERILVDQGATQCEVLFREYASWSVGRLADECGLVMSEAMVETAHAIFRSDWPKLFGPKGRLYLATVDGCPAGVGALKPIDEEAGEIKRMFVRDTHRRLGIARLILEQLVNDARAIGYRKVRLETLTYMREAHVLYRSMGFFDIDRFEAEGSEFGIAQFELFMELEL